MHVSQELAIHPFAGVAIQAGKMLRGVHQCTWACSKWWGQKQRWGQRQILPPCRTASRSHSLSLSPLS